MNSNTVVREELINKTQGFIERSAQLQKITIDQSFFTDPTFTSLRSFSTDVPEQTVGRTDIFGEAESISAVANTTNSEEESQ